MKVNEKFFNRDMSELYEILETSGLCSQEIKSRKERLENSVELIRKTNKRIYYNQYHQRTHEIRSIPFLKQFGSLKIAEDYKHSQGCDFTLNNEIFIECVCSSEGDAEKNGLSLTLHKEGIFDYTKKRILLNIRFISSLCAKVDFYYKRVGKSIIENKPYIIFLSPGSLTHEWFEGNHGMALTDILFGRGNKTLIFDTTTNQIISSGYSHNESIIKHNGKILDCNLFLNNKFKCVSAILLTTALGEKYTNENTFLFINPFAQQKIHESSFPGLIYWKANKKGNYAPYRKGRVLKSSNSF